MEVVHVPSGLHLPRGLLSYVTVYSNSALTIVNPHYRQNHKTRRHSMCLPFGEHGPLLLMYTVNYPHILYSMENFSFFSFGSNIDYMIQSLSFKQKNHYIVININASLPLCQHNLASLLYISELIFKINFEIDILLSFSRFSRFNL